MSEIKSGYKVQKVLVKIYNITTKFNHPGKLTFDSKERTAH